MSEFETLFAEFSPGVRRMLGLAWETLPPDVRENVTSFLPVLPRQKGRWRQLLEMAQTQLAMAFGDKRQVAIIGPTNVGKSTLYNQLTPSSAEKAAVSPIPGTTTVNQSGDSGLFTVIDTPGLDALGRSGQEGRVRALAAANRADFLIIMFDAVQGIGVAEQKLFAQLQLLEKPYIILVNKVDLVRKSEEAVLATLAQALDVEPAQLIPTAAISGYNVERVVLAAVKADPALLTALGQALPAYRWQLAWRAIASASSTAALIGMTPLPLADFLPLVGIQATLVLGIARIYNYPLTRQRAQELLGVFGVGMLGRTLFYELAKLGGPPAWAVAAGVAGATTAALGYAAARWFESGERVSAANIQAIARSITQVLIERLKGLGKKRPSRATLSEEIRQALEQIDLNQP